MSWATSTQEHADDVHDDQVATTDVAETEEETTVTETPKKRPSKRRTKTLAEQYSEAEDRLQTLRERLEEQRDKNRLAFIERLYQHYDVKTIAGDHDDAQRLDALRVMLAVPEE